MLTNMSAQLPPSSTSAASKAAPPSASDGSVAMSASLAVLPPLPISKNTLRSSLFTSRNFRLWRRAFWTSLPIEQADEDQQRRTLQDCKKVNCSCAYHQCLLFYKKKSKSESEKKKYKCRQNRETRLQWEMANEGEQTREAKR